MAKTHLQGMEVNTRGAMPEVGSVAPDFKLVKNDLSEVSLSDLKGKRIVLNMFPSIDTGVCATSVRKFNKEAAELANTVVVCASQDLPFALGRFCGAEGIENAITASDFRYNCLAEGYNTLMVDGPLAGLLSRSVVVIDENGKVAYTELVSEITTEPNYEAALSVLK